MKIIKIFALNFIIFGLLSACSSSVQRVENNITSLNINFKLKEFYPLNSGRTWNYNLEQFQNEQPNTKFKEMTITVVNNTNNSPKGATVFGNTENNGDINTAIIKRFYPNSTIQPNQTLATIYSDHIDLSRYIQQSVFESLNSNFKEKGKDYITILKSPLEVGVTWEGRIFQGGTEKLQIIGIENVIVPAGTFTALKVHHHLVYDNGKEDNLYYWYAEGVGTVKMHEELTFNLSGQWVKLKSIGVLKSFSDK